VATSLDPQPPLQRRRSVRAIPHQRSVDRTRPHLAGLPNKARDSSPTTWRTTYVRSVVAGDVVCALFAAALGFLTRFYLEASSPAHIQVSALWLACLLPLVWPAAMLLAGTYDHRFLWVGAEEFCRVFWAATMLLAGVGTISWALKLEIARGFVVLALPLVMLLTLVLRFAQRRWLRRRRSQGQNLVNVLVIGAEGAVQTLEEQISRMSYRGYRVVGCCLLGPHAGPVPTAGPPVLGDLSEIADIVRRHDVDVVVAVPAAVLSGDQLRRIGWDLEETAADLMLVPAMTEVVPPRVRLRPVFGLATLHVERLDIAGLRGAVKSVLDRAIAAVAIVGLSWAILAMALAINLSSPGPVLFRHERVGRNGRPFHMYKFRSMYHGADKQFDGLLDQSDGNTVQFKMREDPRVTPVGRFLRRFSLDELPQLFNVLGGSMSLVGPRPHVTREVEQYDRDMRRRLLVKPGMTGLWQVSGRSDLSWEDSVRMDVRYVENWSPALDLVILGKTVRAVLQGSGAY
jgi:exopolysaccharide biosynthesis polyprenyl glycosylphosphotransferase